MKNIEDIGCYRMRKLSKRAESGKLKCILCKTDNTPDFMYDICGEIVNVIRIQFDLDDWYIATIGENGHWVSCKDLIFIED